MKQKDKHFLGGKRSMGQLLVAILLIVFPVLMIAFNSSRALRGITWHMPSKIISLLSENKQKSDDVVPVRIKVPGFGIYDPGGSFLGNLGFTLEQVYISWINPDVAAMQEKINQIISNNRIPFVTIEPWSGQNDEYTLLSDIPLGVYDDNINITVDILSGYTGKLYLSWGHEMDQDLTKRYPWSGKEPDLYIDAYRYVQDRIKKGLNNEINWIWSPVVKQGCEKYWPGDNYVDYIGMPVYSYPKWDKSYYGHIRSFKSWYAEKHNLVKQFNKPVFIVEFGVTGSMDYQTFWLQEAFETFTVLPSLEYVLFFYAEDTEGSWGEEFGTPDWRTDPGTVTGLVDWINQYEYKPEE